MVHTPVLLNEVLKFLDPRPGEFLIDGTADGGGHASALLARVLPGGKLLAVDLDEEMLEAGRKYVTEGLPRKDSEAFLVQTGNYAELPAVLAERNLPKADGLLLDLGFSSVQLDAGRGFSFAKDEPLLMTYARDDRPVAELLRTMGEAELADIIRRYSGEKYARKISRAIKEASRRKRITSTGELRQAIVSAVPRNYERGRIDPATRTFQALRIHANRELDNLAEVLDKLPEILAPGGRVAIIAFHSLEDELVKEKFRDMARKGEMEVLTRKPVVASAEEVARNPRSRSAKLRAGRLNSE